MITLKQNPFDMEKASDLQQFNQLFRDYQGRFIRFANSYVRDTTIAEDFTIEALMYYWENRHSLEPNSNIPAYILGIIKHKCLNHLQRNQVKKAADDKLAEQAAWELSTRIASLEACEPYELFTAEMQQIVDETLVTLPEQTRNIFIMSRYHNKSHKEIAEELGVSTKTVEFHISKALKVLREALRDYLPFFFYFFI